MNFDFLKNVELNVPETKVASIRSTASKNPKGMCIRVFATGKIYPSQQLSEELFLEYQAKDTEIIGNGLDIFKSIDWPMFPINAPEQFIFVAPVPKNSPKVDLFGQVGYDESGNPKNSVLEQGGGSFGAQLLEMLEQVYGIVIEKGKYVDLEVKTDITVTSPNGIYYVPKTVTRGDKKGELSVVRRENILVMPLVPLVDIIKSTEDATQMQIPFSEITEIEEVDQNEVNPDSVEEVVEFIDEGEETEAMDAATFDDSSSYLASPVFE